MFEKLKSLFKKSPRNIKAMIEEGAIIIDVRTPFEFKSGHLAKSKNISLDMLPSNR